MVVSCGQSLFGMRYLGDPTLMNKHHDPTAAKDEETPKPCVDNDNDDVVMLVTTAKMDQSQ